MKDRIDELKYGNRLLQDQKLTKRINKLAGLIDTLADLVPADHYTPELRHDIEDVRPHQGGQGRGGCTDGTAVGLLLAPAVAGVLAFLDGALEDGPGRHGRRIVSLHGVWNWMSDRSLIRRTATVVGRS